MQSKQYKVFRQYDGRKENLYSKKLYSEMEIKRLFKLIKDGIKANDGFIIGEGEEGFYARTCKLSTPFTFRKELLTNLIK